jgi:hypothetical protein
MATTRFGGWSTDRTYDMDAGSISFKWEQHSQELVLAVENYMGGKLSIAGVTFHDLHTLNHILEEFLGEMWKPDDEI